MEKKRFLVFGAGAIGTYIGGSLLRGSQEVTFLDRETTAIEIRQSGLSMVLDGIEYRMQNVPVISSLQQALEQTPFDLGILAIKSFDTQSFVETLSPFKDKVPIILCLQNGVENEALLRQAIGKEKVISGSVTSAVRRIKAGQIILEKLRGIGMAGDTPMIDDLIMIFNHAGLNARKYGNETSMKWSKLLTNLLANASAAILNMLPGEIFSNPALFKLEMCQLREAISVMKAMDCPVVDLPATPVRLLAMGAGLPFSVSQPVMNKFLSKGRGDKKPSLLIDMQNNSEYSEVDYLNGAVVRFGENLGIQTPVNRLLTDTLIAMIKDRINRVEFDHHPEKLFDKLSI
jgi:2-dehydropantoate 2-reductase